jgi:glucose/mannose-6-phosphate isomerase
MPAAVITTGGRLAEGADRAGVPRLALAPGSPPRAALPGALPTLLKVLDGVGAPVDGLQEALHAAGDALRAGVRDFGPDLIASENPAKSLALWLDRELPIIYAPTWPLGPVAVRWRGQFAENAKRLSFGHTLPEMNHNEIVGWSAQEDLYPRMRAIFLEDSETGDRTALRARLTADLIRKAGAPVRVYRGEGEHLLARMMHLVCLADFASVYLALGWGIDPTPVAAIDHLKQRLAEESS